MGYSMECTDTITKNNSYTHFISLGYFCSVAMELERIGLRSSSSPFDWLISDFTGVINVISNHFKDFLDYDLLFQNHQYHQIYRNIKYDLTFFHDFDKYRPLQKQLPAVTIKYNQRIERFYRNIKEPTLFIRYISDEKKDIFNQSVELLWIEDNIKYIKDLLQSFNPENDILFIANMSVISDKIKIYHVMQDENDTVARMPLEKNEELSNLLNGFEYKQRSQNLAYYEKKRQSENSFAAKTQSFITRGTKKVFLREYIHNQQY